MNCLQLQNSPWSLRVRIGYMCVFFSVPVCSFRSVCFLLFPYIPSPNHSEWHCRKIFVCKKTGINIEIIASVRDMHISIHTYVYDYVYIHENRRSDRIAHSSCNTHAFSQIHFWISIKFGFALCRDRSTAVSYTCTRTHEYIQHTDLHTRRSRTVQSHIVLPSRKPRERATVNSISKRDVANQTKKKFIADIKFLCGLSEWERKFLWCDDDDWF